MPIVANRPPFTRALVTNVTGLVLALGLSLLVAMLWQARSSTAQAAREEIVEALDRGTERLQILLRATEMAGESVERAARWPEVTGATLRATMENSLAAFEQRPELSYLGVVLPTTGEYGNLERTADGDILLWLFPGLRTSDPVQRNFILTSKGFVPRDARPAGGYDPRSRPFYQAALDSPGGTWVSAYQWIIHPGSTDPAPDNPLWGLSYVKAIRDDTGRLIGVLDTDFDLTALNSFVASLAQVYGATFQVIELGATPRLLAGRGVQRTPLPLPGELAGLARFTGATFVDRMKLEGERRWAAARRLTLQGGSSWLVVASRSDPVIAAPLRRQPYQVLGVGLALLAGLVLLSIHMSRRLGRPLAELQQRVAEFGRRGPDAPVAPPAASGGFRETQLLDDSFNHMAAAIRQQAASLALKAAIIDSTDTSIFSLDSSRCILEWNTAAERLFGIAREQAIGRNVAAVVRAPDGPADWNAILTRQEAGTVRLCGAHGEFDAELRLVAFNQGGQEIRALLLNDITERQLAEQRLQHVASHDHLTGLPNRGLILSRIADAVTRARGSGGQLALLYLDLDRFKVINDGYGHPFGDEVLRAAGERLGALVREGDTVARHGGDEFLILMNDLHKASDAYAVARKIVGSLDQPLTVQGRQIYLSGSVGVSVFPQDGETADALIGNANIAMYRAKSLGRNNFHFFTPALKETQVRIDLETRLRGAAGAGQLHLLYQPRVSLDSGRITGCEALLRWQHPELGLIPPDVFIPIAEESGLIVPIGDWVLRTACRQAKAWLDAGLPPVHIAVNVSARQFLQQDVAAWVMRTLQEAQLPPGSLELELTESLIAQDTAKAIATVGELRQAGVQLSIDDFGTGYSSLNYLKRFQVHALKIDQSFVHNLLSSTEDATIVLTVISLAHSLDFKVIAEGVETAEQCGFLRMNGCDEIQGFYFSKPVPAAEFEALLRGGVRYQ
jgi:diguanylate cyclase (GGDEF)-like protein/PAS domain S-box-containing protein